MANNITIRVTKTFDENVVKMDPERHILKIGNNSFIKALKTIKICKNLLKNSNSARIPNIFTKIE